MSLITREDQPIAAVLHDPASLDAVMLQQEIGPAARLAIDNERLRAEARARLRELKTSRTRIVEAGDAERRRLERDLHDGAQQRLVGLCVVLAMAREQRSLPALEAADADLHRAIDDLRELAHGIHPAELSDEGLAAALETLADRAPVAVAPGGAPGGARAGHGRDRGVRARRRGPATRRRSRRRVAAQRGGAPRRRRAHGGGPRRARARPSTSCWASWSGSPTASTRSTDA